jgi:uncharacterized protein
MTFRLRVFVIIAALLVSIPCLAVTPPVPDSPMRHIVDLANILESDVETKLIRFLTELEQKTSAQVAVLTINSLDGESLERFSLHIAHDRWKLGQKGKDNGALLLVSLGDKKYRFEIGYGLEGILPDSLVGSIGRQFLVPYFRKGDYGSGVTLAVLAVVNEIAKNEGVNITGFPDMSRFSSSAPQKKKFSIVRVIFSILFFAVALILFIRHPWLFLLFFLGGGRRSGWGGSYGGGFGGGGGGFGGGGASGGW